MKKALPLILFFVLISLYGNNLWALEAGVSQIDITPRLGLKMTSFDSRTAEGVAIPMYVRVLVFRSGERSIGFVVHDLFRPMGSVIQAELKEKALEQLGLKELVFNASHNHSSPVFRDGKIDELQDYEKEICDKTFDAVVQAYHSLKPVRIGMDFGRVDLNYERHVSYADGSSNPIWWNHNKIPKGPVDPSVGVTRIDDMQGKTIAVLVNYACHPVIFGRLNRLYSADFPGALCPYVQKNIEGNPICIYIQGCAGDMNPYYAAINVEDDDALGKCNEVGKELGDEVIRVLRHISTQPNNDTLSVRYVTKNYDTGIKGRNETKVTVPVTSILITSDIGYVALPGEPYVKFQQDLRRSSPVKFLLVAGYTSGGGYYPDISNALRGDYGDNQRVTGVGEHMVIEALVSLHELLGDLKPYYSE